LDDDFQGIPEEDWGDWDGDLSPPPFEEPDVNDLFLQEVLDSLGIESVAEIVIDFSDVENVSNLRGDRFTSPEEAFIFLYNIGVLGFSDVVYFPDEDVYGVEIDDDTP
jgi:hypothetical protein